ncbi:MAG: two-component sensor histidine kinase [Aliivibrio sp.]|uniref:ATP-binding protein n=1 Tax=Aliivibrio sp. TaxID=1872443 RepID=UPI001A38835C|nr:two-component sensor histidine kinase [Aliivibrio sp.]
MFSHFFIRFIVIIVITFLLALVLLDDLYIKGVKADQLTDYQALSQLVINDLNAQPDNQLPRLLYWQSVLNHYIDQQALTELPLSEKERTELEAIGHFIDVTSNWTVDDITLYFINPRCDCVLVMQKNPGNHKIWETYLQAILVLIFLTLAALIFVYAVGNKKRVKDLTDVYQAYGDGAFDVRADEKTPMPYKPFAITFNTMALQIKSLLQEQKNLINGVSHDLRTPIARLRFALDMTRNCDSVEQYRKRIQEMDLDLDELDNLVEDWLFYAQLNGRSLPIDSQPFDLSKTIQLCLDKLTPLFPSISISYDALPASIHGDSKLLTRAIENVVMNALKFATTKVRISLVTLDSQLHLSIEDDGSGIDTASKSTVLQPFVRLNNSHNVAGSGLGLTIVKSILDKHQAKLVISDSSLGGACFTLVF